MLGFPEQDLDDRQARLPGVFIDQPRDVLGRRVAVHLEYALTTFSQQGQEWIVATQQHVMVKMIVDPVLDLPLDLGEIDQHAARIELRALQGDHGTAGVPMQMTALALVIQQAMTITKLDLARHSKHDGPDMRPVIRGFHDRLSPIPPAGEQVRLKTNGQALGRSLEATSSRPLHRSKFRMRKVRDFGMIADFVINGGPSRYDLRTGGDRSAAPVAVGDGAMQPVQRAGEVGKVFINDLVVRGIIGVNDSERESPQEIVINLGLFTDLRRAGATDDIADCIDYQMVAEKVMAHAESARRFTVEALAADIARIGLGRARSRASARPGGKARCGPFLPLRRRRDRAGTGPLTRRAQGDETAGCRLARTGFSTRKARHERT